MRLIGNILWFLFGGFLLGLSWFFAGILWCVTIIGIPWGLQCFKFAKLTFWPFGKDIQYGGGARPPPGKAAGRPPCSRKKPLSTQETAAGKTEGGDPAFYPAWPWGDDRYQIRNAGATRCTQVPARGIVAKYSPTCCPAGYPRGNRCRR